MNGFQLKPRRGAARKKRQNLTPAVAPKLASVKETAFGDDADSDDSSDPTPKARKVTRITAETSPPSKESKKEQSVPKEEHFEQPSGPKTSQIARIIARRRKAEDALRINDQMRNERDEALFRYDVDSCADEVEASTYTKRPVEGFGEMLLKGMGWTGSAKLAEVGAGDGPVARPGRLGLGAKLGAFNNVALPGARSQSKIQTAKEPRDGDHSHNTSGGKYGMGGTIGNRRVEGEVGAEVGAEAGTGEPSSKKLKVSNNSPYLGRSPRGNERRGYESAGERSHLSSRRR